MSTWTPHKLIAINVEEFARLCNVALETAQPDKQAALDAMLEELPVRVIPELLKSADDYPQIEWSVYRGWINESTPSTCAPHRPTASSLGSTCWRAKDATGRFLICIAGTIYWQRYKGNAAVRSFGLVDGGGRYVTWGSNVNSDAVVAAFNAYKSSLM